MDPSLDTSLPQTLEDGARHTSPCMPPSTIPPALCKSESSERTVYPETLNDGAPHTSPCTTPSASPPPAPFRLPYIGIRKKDWLEKTLNHVFGRKPGDVDDAASIVQDDDDLNFHLYVARAGVTRRRTLSPSNQELLRCVGLDMFVMIRLLQFGFDISFYPFLVTSIFLIPFYVTSNCSNEDCGAYGYYAATTANLEKNSNIFWATSILAVLYYLWFLYRLHIEWEIFIIPRLDFLKRGGSDEDHPELLNQYQKTALIEYIPETHRCDEMLSGFFDELFPGQVQRAEVLVRTETLSELIAKRQTLIEKYENIVAQNEYLRLKYKRAIKCGRRAAKPKEPTMKVGAWGKRKLVEALPYLRSEIKKQDALVEVEHLRIVRAKATQGCGRVSKSANRPSFFSKFLGGIKDFVQGADDSFICSTGFVEFKSLAAKQSATALKSYMTGRIEFMQVEAATDAKNIIWPNVTAKAKNIQIKTRITHTFFFIMLAPYVMLILEFAKLINSNTLPESWLFRDTFAEEFATNRVPFYIVVILMELIMFVVRVCVRTVANRFTKIKVGYYPHRSIHSAILVSTPCV